MHVFSIKCGFVGLQVVVVSRVEQLLVGAGRTGRGKQPLEEGVKTVAAPLHQPLTLHCCARGGTCFTWQLCTPCPDTNIVGREFIIHGLTNKYSSSTELMGVTIVL